MTDSERSTSLRRVLISAGGTGGHIFPGLATAEACQEQGVTVYWIGSDRTLDKNLVPEAVPFHALPMRGWRGRGILGRCRTLLALLRSCWSAWRYMRQVSPDVVLTFGGYVTVPVGLVAKVLGIPLVIHEQNCVAGSANRLLSRFAKRCMSAFPQVLPKAQVCGNPLRAAFNALTQPTPACVTPGECRVLVLGGSLGASAINSAVLALVSQWQEEGMTLSVTHQTGESDYQRVQSAYADLNATVSVTPFVDDMLAAMTWADVVIARSGALTVSELAAAGVASILIPYPQAIDDHQFKNAMWLGEAGAAIVIREERLSSEQLVSIVASLAQDPGRCRAMAQAAFSLHQPGAAMRLVRACKEVLRCDKSGSQEASGE